MRPAPRPQLLAINPLPTLPAASPPDSACRGSMPSKKSATTTRKNNRRTATTNAPTLTASLPCITSAANRCCSSTTSPILADLHHRRRSHPHQWRCARCGRNRHAHRAHSGRLRYRHPAGQPAQSQHQLQMMHRSAKRATAAALALAPEVGFTTAHAATRSHHPYILADSAIVVHTATRTAPAACKKT